MTKFTSLLLLLALLYSCTPKEAQNTETAETEEAEVEASELIAVCVWDGVSVRETPGPKKKYITALSVGESLTYLGEDTLIDERTYSKVKLNDEKTGWTMKDFLVLEATPAVVLRETSIYSRPDLLTKKDESFAKMDIVASTETEGDWIKIRGKRTGGKWMDDGWIKKENLSYDQIDIATAKFAQEALSLEDKESKIGSLKEIIENTDLNGSKFIAGLVVELTKLTEEDEVMEEDIPETDSLAMDEE
ncbi:SH3 domain-containing protein [Reichenbachiella ulvae]|uniref:SH3 domain-containing protein n=1 Tax=Reichenbachiella ulvae TaxID=2980104 RepID=A0ABT3CV18_9BACT|nr:SH3 domain-containing protein [Reichenbachiella ulvae]MCV9387088.1 SH3 domain-containing protein [Reichenbachiella ulvae]